MVLFLTPHPINPITKTTNGTRAKYSRETDWPQSKTDLRKAKKLKNLKMRLRQPKKLRLKRKGLEAAQPHEIPASVILRGGNPHPGHARSAGGSLAGRHRQTGRVAGCLR